MRREDGRLDPAKIGGPGAAVGDTLVWDGMRWVPGPPLGLAVVDTDEPADPPTGLFWFDEDDTC